MTDFSSPDPSIEARRQVLRAALSGAGLILFGTSAAAATPVGSTLFQPGGSKAGGDAKAAKTCTLSNTVSKSWTNSVQGGTYTEVVHFGDPTRTGTWTESNAVPQAGSLSWTWSFTRVWGGTATLTAVQVTALWSVSRSDPYTRAETISMGKDQVATITVSVPSGVTESRTKSETYTSTIPCYEDEGGSPLGQVVAEDAVPDAESLVLGSLDAARDLFDPSSRHGVVRVNI